MMIFNYSRFGPTPRYNGSHVYLALDMLVREGRCSRARLAEELGIGEGSTRGLLDTMRRWGMVSVSRAGVTATEDGAAVFRDTSLRLVEPVCRPGSGFLCGAVVGGMAERFTDGYAQRDMAIRNGADESCVFAMLGGVLHGLEVQPEGIPEEEARGVIESAGMEEGDMLVIVSCGDRKAAMSAAASVGIEMLRCRSFLLLRSRRTKCRLLPRYWVWRETDNDRISTAGRAAAIPTGNRLSSFDSRRERHPDALLTRAAERSLRLCGGAFSRMKGRMMQSISNMRARI
ncbi:MAG: hypothetical protein IKQ60_04555 [Candidatus Methanomethylophilaceae archaeon]|nr:hypothetical protein [Candidatus Methanomethylophilaceae archaeon]